MEQPITICKKAASISNEFERNNCDLKRDYLVRNINLYNQIVANVTGYKGSFGTGYPFYALRKDLNGRLPIIDEQIRYNDELISTVQNCECDTWVCSQCLSQNANSMPDLKQRCKPCLDIDDALKPRRILTRLPDINMWMVCDDECISQAKDELISLFEQYGLSSSDIDPVQTIYDLAEINDNLKKGIMPDKKLPIDANIIGYSKLSSLISQVPDVLIQSTRDGMTPYLPIQPLAYRKTWQYDDTPYNFIHDYLSSLTEFNFDRNLYRVLADTRRSVANSYSVEELYRYLTSTGPYAVKRRLKVLELKDRFRERIISWQQ